MDNQLEQLLARLNKASVKEEMETVLNDINRTISSRAPDRINADDGKTYVRSHILDEKVPMGVRVATARVVINHVIRAEAPIFIARSEEMTKGKSAKAISEILSNPKKYGLDDKDVDKLLDSAWYLAGGDDSLSEEAVKEKYIQSAGNGTDNIYTKNTSVKKRRQRIDERGFSEEEYREARRGQTAAYFSSIAIDSEKSSAYSNSANELKDFESSIVSFYQASSKAKGIIDKTKLLERSGDLAKAFSKAETALKLYKDPAGFAATKIAKKLGADVMFASAKKATAKAIASSMLKLAARLGLSAIPGIGAAIQFLAPLIVDKLIEPILKYLGKLRSVAKRFSKLAGGATAGLLILITQGIPSGIVAAATSTLVSTILLVPVIAFIMFIINSGGYIVPPGPNLGSGPSDDNNIGGGGDPTVTENQYIRVVKRPSPGGPFPNPAPGSRRVVDYTIEITALESELTEVTFLYKCEAVKEGDAILNCPENNPVIPESPPSQIIPTGAPFIIRYSVAYDSAYSDSVVMDSLLVTARVAGRTTRTSGFASIVFGTPPTRCFDLVGDWPQREQSIMLAAVAQINRAPLFVQKICSRTRVNLRYNPTQAVFQGKPYGGFTSYPNIEFYPLALRNYNSAFYTLSHEIGHIIANTTTLLSQFREAAPYNSGGFICTYPFRYPIAETNQSEDFAEMVAQYYMGQSLSSETRDFTCMNGGNLRTRYPRHFIFAQDVVFEESLSWPNTN